MELAQIVERLGGTLEGDPAVEVIGISGVEFAGPADATFAVDDAMLAKAEASPACCVIVSHKAPSSAKTLIRCESPNGYAADLLEFFHPPQPPVPGIHPTAVIAESARIAETASIGPHVTVGNRCRIADRAQLLAGVSLGDDCEVGADTVIHPNVTLYANTRIGARVIIHAGAVIGADGFGYFPDRGRLRKWPHVGNVVIEDEVEIGANTCIDRAKFDTTLIQHGAKLDNLCQIAHNSRVGRGAIVAGMTGLAGGAVLEDGVVCGGQVAVSEHVTVGRGATVAGQSGVISDIPPGQVHSGMPSKPHRKKMQEVAMIGFLADHARTVRKLIRDRDQA